MGLKAVAASSAAAFNPANPGPIGATTPANGRFTGVQAGIRVVVASTTAVSSDFTILCNAGSVAIVVTLPAASANPGRIYNIKKTDAGANTVTITPNGADTIDLAANRVITTAQQNIQMQSDGTSGWWLL